MTFQFMSTESQSPFVGQDGYGQQQRDNSRQFDNEELGAWHRYNDKMNTDSPAHAPREEVQAREPMPSRMEEHHDQQHPRYEAQATTNGEISRGSPEAVVSQTHLQPKRRKAKRACMACQRAHLTCGDERPCDRCVKRGLADSCQDGVRKKAKYLHDAPNDVLNPTMASAVVVQGGAMDGVRAVSTPIMRPPASTAMYPRVASLPVNDLVANENAATTQHNGLRPAQEEFYNNAELSRSIPNGPSFKPQPPAHQMLGQIMEPNANNAALFNLDIASMNFDNHYGALEFGMLGHITANTAKSNEADTSSMSPSIGGTPSMPARIVDPSAGIQGDINMSGIIAGQQHQHQPQQKNLPAAVDPHPFGSGHSNMNNLSSSSNAWVSPLSATPPQHSRQQPGQQPHHLQSSVASSVVPTGPPKQRYPSASHTPLAQATHRQQPPQHRNKPLAYAIAFSSFRHPDSSHFHPSRNPSELYESIRRPYSYTAGFHRLSAYIHRRFTPSQTLHIAKSLASIRPSLIATNKTLDAADLIFMEKCFQRTLWEYEDFIHVVGTPTLVCRRTGEVAAVGREFCVLTGWTREVLLGLAPNLNVSSGGTAGAASKVPSGDTHTVPDGYSRQGNVNNPSSTARTNETSPGDGTNVSSSQIQPVLLAELLDDQSVVDFYDDFAKMAFNDSRGSIVRTCKLLRYKPRQRPSRQSDASDTIGNNGVGQADYSASTESHNPPFPWAVRNRGSSFSVPSSPHWTKNGIVGESEVERDDHLAEDKVECSCCWTVKRDVFDIPMLIVMNFLPCI